MPHTFTNEDFTRLHRRWVSGPNALGPQVLRAHGITSDWTLGLGFNQRPKVGFWFDYPTALRPATAVLLESITSSWDEQDNQVLGVVQRLIGQVFGPSAAPRAQTQGGYVHDTILNPTALRYIPTVASPALSGNPVPAYCAHLVTVRESPDGQGVLFVPSTSDQTFFSLFDSVQQTGGRQLADQLMHPFTPPVPSQGDNASSSQEQPSPARRP